MSTTNEHATGRRTARASQHVSSDFLDDTPQDVEPVDMMATNVAVLSMDGRLEPITMREFKEKAEYEAFMEDPVVIQINETTDVNAAPIVFVGVNGDSRWLPRGVPIKLQRKFVERLAQAQEMRFTTTMNRNQDEDNAMRLTRKQAQSYGFAVIRDDHPAARRWLLRITRSGS